ncbi:flagellar motor switch protein FliM [Rubeoparvulum massiliense]|uniref:flagellar motor switch protein FliM n=1 Tax=Rubeoparvulum massiliense TaxID=1631346 RepID=UPI00065E913A|nr:flagellar motor switch protein FliM [Rubeoparvulum massiliense]
MAEVLSQNEIDSLLAALSSGEMDAEQLKQEKTEKKVKTYDFKRALRFSKDQIRSLTRIHENFARLLTTYFSAALRTFVQINVASVDQLPYDEFIRSIPKMTILNIFEAPPLEGRMVLEVNPNIAYAMLDRLMGGRGVTPSKIDHLTEIETIILEKIFSKALDHFNEAWKNVIECEAYLDVMETNPQFMQIVSPNETVAVISLSTKIGEVSGMVNLCLPHVVLEPIMPNLSAHYWMGHQKKSRDEGELVKLQQNVSLADIPVITELGQSTMTIQEFLQLAVNDVIVLNQEVEQPLIVYVDHIPKFYGQPGTVKGKLAVQITGLYRKGEDEDE